MGIASTRWSEQWGLALALGAALLLTGASVSPADERSVLDSGPAMVDLTTPGASALIGGAWFLQANPQPTGTGVLDPFLRIQGNGNQNGGIESGYNTDYRPVEFQTKDSNHWTHSITLDDVPLVAWNGNLYRQFILDINEPASATTRLLSLDSLQLFLADAGDRYGYPNLGRLVYDMDKDLASGSVRDASVVLNSHLNSGSGSGDMSFLVPDRLFRNSSEQYVYLYSSFGQAQPSASGFEEWSVRSPGRAATTPLPAGAYLGLAGFAGVMLVQLARRSRSGI